MEGYLKDHQGNYIMDRGGYVPIDRLIHDVDEFGRLRPGASQYGPGGPSPTARPRTYSPPLTRSYRQPLQPLRKIGNPGVWTNLTAWWSKLPTWQKGALIGVPVVAGVAIAASQKGGKGSTVNKI